MKGLIIVRMDDICSTMNWENFMRYKTLFDELGIKPLLGIVPLPTDEKLVCGQVNNFWEFIDQLRSEGWQISMHGCHHKYTSSGKGLICNRRKSEFAGLPIEKQRELLLKGKNFLLNKGIDTDIFMPPGHSYDKNTLIAMRDTGFKYLTDGMSLRPYKLAGITCIPADSAYRLHFLGLLTICIHSNEDNDKKFMELKCFLEKNRKRIISYSDAKTLTTFPYFVCRIEELLRICARELITNLAFFISKIF